MAQRPHLILGLVITGSPASLLDIRFAQHTVAYLAGEPNTRARIDNDKVLTPSTEKRGKGRGGPRMYSFEDALTLAAARSLVEDACLTVATAAQMVGQQGHVLLHALFAGRDLHYARGRGMILGFDYAKAAPTADAGARALVTLRPHQVYLEMRPRCAECFPEETAEFERKLAELRSRHAREQPLLDELAERHRREHADLDERLLSQRSASDKPGEQFQRERDAKRELREQHQREEMELRARLRRERGERE